MPFNLTCLMIQVLRCFKHVLTMCYNVLHSQMFLILWQLEFRTPLARIFLALGVYQVRLNRKDLEPEYLKTLFPQEPWRRLCYLDTPSVKKVGRSGAGFCKRICTIYDRYTWYMSAYNRYIEIHIRIFTLKSGTGLVFGMLFFSYFLFVCSWKILFCGKNWWLF